MVLHDLEYAVAGGTQREGVLKADLVEMRDPGG